MREHFHIIENEAVWISHKSNCVSTENEGLWIARSSKPGSMPVQATAACCFAWATTHPIRRHWFMEMYTVDELYTSIINVS